MKAVLYKNITAISKRVVRVFVRGYGPYEIGYSPGLGKDEMLTPFIKNEPGRIILKATSLIQKYNSYQLARSQVFRQGVRGG